MTDTVEHDAAATAATRANGALLGGLVIGVLVGALGAYGWGKLAGVDRPAHEIDPVIIKKLDTIIAQNNYVANRVYNIDNNVYNLSRKIGATGMLMPGSAPGAIGTAPTNFGATPGGSTSPGGATGFGAQPEPQ